MTSEYTPPRRRPAPPPSSPFVGRLIQHFQLVFRPGAPILSDQSDSSDDDPGRPRVVQRPTHAVRGIEKRQSRLPKRASASRVRRPPAGLIQAFDERPTGPSPELHSPRSFGHSHKSSTSSRSMYSRSSGPRRSADTATTAPTSVEHSSSPGRAPLLGKVAQSPDAVPIGTPVPDLRGQPNADASRIEPWTRQTDGSGAASLAMPPLVTSRPLPRTPQQQEDEITVTPLRSSVRSAAASPPTASSSRLLEPGPSSATRRSQTDPDPSLVSGPLTTRRSRSLSDLGMSSQHDRVAGPSTTSIRPHTAPEPEAIARRAGSARHSTQVLKGPIIYEPAHLNCDTWLTPRPRLIGRFKWEEDAPLMVARRDRTLMSSIERREAARKAQHRASRLVRGSIISYQALEDPRSQSLPIPWSPASGLAESGSPPRAASFDFITRKWRSPLKPKTRSMATQTPGDDDIGVILPRRNSIASVRELTQTDVQEKPEPRRRSSSLSHFYYKSILDMAARPALEPGQLADPLPVTQTGYNISPRPPSRGRLRTITTDAAAQTSHDYYVDMRDYRIDSRTGNTMTKVYGRRAFDDEEARDVQASEFAAAGTSQPRLQDVKLAPVRLIDDLSQRGHTSYQADVSDVPIPTGSDSMPPDDRPQSGLSASSWLDLDASPGAEEDDHFDFDHVRRLSRNSQYLSADEEHRDRRSFLDTEVSPARSIGSTTEAVYVEASSEPLSSISNQVLSEIGFASSAGPRAALRTHTIPRLTLDDAESKVDNSTSAAPDPPALNLEASEGSSLRPVSSEMRRSGSSHSDLSFDGLGFPAPPSTALVVNRGTEEKRVQPSSRVAEQHPSTIKTAGRGLRQEIDFLEFDSPDRIRRTRAPTPAEGISTPH